MLSSVLLRSVIRCGDEAEDALASNLYHLRSEVQPTDIDASIMEFVGDIYDKTHIIPNLTLILTAFINRTDGLGIAASTRLDVVKQCNFLTGPEFRYELDSFKKELLSGTLSQTLINASNILTVGLTRSGREMKGPDAALDYVASALSSLTTQLKRGSIEGSFRRDAQKVRKQYEFWKANPGDTVGVLTGLDRLDIAHRGAKPGELILVAGFVSHLKTSFCINWLYRASILFGRNVAIASLEMSVEVLRVLLYVMHSTHSKFLETGNQPLDIDRVTTGSLSPSEEEFFGRVIDDFESNPDYGEIFYKEPEESLTVSEVQRWAESKHRQKPLDMLVIDYLGLIDPGKNVSSLDSSANLNKVIRQAKLMSLTFAQNRGIAVVSPFQTNREGLKEAEKSGGRYKLTALANANESERSSDKVYYTYMDEVLRNSRELLIGNMKTRNGPVVETFKVFADPTTRVIDNLDSTVGAGEGLVEL